VEQAKSSFNAHRSVPVHLHMSIRPKQNKRWRRFTSRTLMN